MICRFGMPQKASRVRDAPEGQQCRPRSIAIVAPDLEQGNVVIDLGTLGRCGGSGPRKAAAIELCGLSTLGVVE
jgi:hypothetical protein